MNPRPLPALVLLGLAACGGAPLPPPAPEAAAPVPAPPPAPPKVDPSAELAAAIDPLFAKYATPGSPGCAVGVFRAGEIVLAKGYGYASLEHGVPIGPSTVFEIASMSKQLTATAVLLLAQDGRLGLDDDVRKYVPELPSWGHDRPVAVQRRNDLDSLRGASCDPSMPMSAPRSTRRLFCASLGRALVAVAGCARPPWPPPVSPSPSAPEIAGKYLGVFRGQETV